MKEKVTTWMLIRDTEGKSGALQHQSMNRVNSFRDDVYPSLEGIATKFAETGGDKLMLLDKFAEEQPIYFLPDASGWASYSLRHGVPKMELNLGRKKCESGKGYGDLSSSLPNNIELLSHAEVEDVFSAAFKAYKDVLKELHYPKDPPVRWWMGNFAEATLDTINKNRLAYKMLKAIENGEFTPDLPWVFDEVPVGGACVPKKLKWKKSYNRLCAVSARKKYSLNSVYAMAEKFRAPCGYIGRTEPGSQIREDLGAVFNSECLPTIVTIDKYKGYENRPYSYDGYEDDDTEGLEHYREIALVIRSFGRDQYNDSSRGTYLLGVNSSEKDSVIDRAIQRKFSTSFMETESVIFQAFNTVKWTKVVRRRATLEEYKEMLKTIVRKTRTRVERLADVDMTCDRYWWGNFGSEEYQEAIKGNPELSKKPVKTLLAIYDKYAYKLGE